LLIREFGSFAVFSEVNLAFIPDILAQKDFFRDPPSGWGGFKFIPSFFADARPLAFSPPFGFFPSLRCHAGDLAIEHRRGNVGWNTTIDAVITYNTFSGNQYINRNAVSDINFHQYVVINTYVTTL
jgi:hypothetical protein